MGRVCACFDYTDFVVEDLFFFCGCLEFTVHSKLCSHNARTTRTLSTISTTKIARIRTDVLPVS